MDIQRLTVGPLWTNCYILSDGENCMIMDPGGDHEAIIEFLKARKLAPKLILATHGHFDHILSVNELKSRFHVPFFICEKDIELVDDFSDLVKKYLGYDPGPSPVPDHFVSDKETLNLGKETVNVVETPGHTPGSCSFIIGNNLFSGDFIFSGSIGRIDFGGSYADMSRSLKWAKELPGDFKIYPGHGDFTSLDIERETNPFFKESINHQQPDG